MIYLFYVAYVQCANKEKKNLFLDFALLSSLYLVINFQRNFGYDDFLIFINVPLMIAYVNKREFAGMAISLLIICYYYQLNVDMILLLCIQYLGLYSIYKYYDYKKKDKFLFVKSFIIIKIIFSFIFLWMYKILTIDTILDNGLAILLFSIVSYLMIYTLKKGEDIVNLHISIKQLQTETQYRTSLFKITHEIKNPIAVCKSYLDMFNFDNPDHRRYIPIVKEEIQKILFLLQDFLSMNKIKIEKEMLDITMLLEEVIEQYKPILSTSGITFHYEILDDELYIEGDYNRLMQVMINMIKNSMEAKGDNSLSITLKSERKKNQLKITLIDTGTGFDMKELEKIKEPFYTTKKNGTGLGVSLSYEIIAAHNGTISYTSKLGVGTKVEITFPLVDLS